MATDTMSLLGAEPEPACDQNQRTPNRNRQIPHDHGLCPGGEIVLVQSSEVRRPRSLPQPAAASRSTAAIHLEHCWNPLGNTHKARHIIKIATREVRGFQALLHRAIRHYSSPARILLYVLGATVQALLLHTGNHQSRVYNVHLKLTHSIISS